MPESDHGHQHVFEMGRTTSGFSCKRAQSTLVIINVPLLKGVAYLVEIVEDAEG